jgi:outer membrane protein assembly factor BamA
VKYGATLGGFVDVDGQQRVLGLSLIADFADPLRSDGQIPFAEQVGLGGERPMRGFLEGRLLDRSAVVAQLEYRGPVWVWLDGTFHYAVGNVFGRHLGGFEADLLRQSFGIGLRANNARDHAFEILSAFGTETFEQGGRVDTFRFVLGASSGF